MRICSPPDGRRVGAGPQSRWDTRPVEAKPALVANALVAVEQRHDVRTDRGTVLEPVPRAAPDEPGVGKVWMPIDQEVRIDGRLVLADASLDDGRHHEVRKATCAVGANRLDRAGIHDA